MPQRGIDAERQFFFISGIAQVTLDVQLGGQGKPDDVVEVGHGQVIGVLRFDQALFCFGQFDLGPQHVDFGDDADFKLQFHVLQVAFQSLNRFLVQFDVVARRHELEVGVGGVILELLAGFGDAPLAGVER